MDSVVVDTDVVSYLFKRDTRAVWYEPHLEDRTLLLSFMTKAELDYWMVSRHWGETRCTRLAAFLHNFTFIDSDRALCRKWAEVCHQVERDGFKIDCADAWIAATAVLYNVPLVTHNRQHFAHVNGLTVISEAPVERENS